MSGRIQGEVMTEVTVRPVQTDEERTEMYSFRYQVYVNEFGMTTDADSQRGRLKDEYDEHCLSYALYEKEEIVGSLRCIFLSELLDPTSLIEKFQMAPAIDAFGLEAIATTSRFMISPHLRNTRYILRLMDEAFREGQRRGIRLNYGDCSPHLLPFYERLGYRRYTSAYNDLVFGYKVPILMLTQDQGFLKRVRSPLARSLTVNDDDPTALRWFSANYANEGNLESAAFLRKGEFFDLLAKRISSDPLHTIALLQGLERSEAEKFLKRATVLRVRPGDKIIRKGESDNTLFIILSGAARVALEGTDAPPLAILERGDMFGEIGFLNARQRTADVVTNNEGELLVLSGEAIKRFIATDPAIGAKLLINLSRELAARFTISMQYQAQ